ncbi:hypothetical protein, partial [Rhizobium sp. SEMIA 4085]|uniref:hypothetical protein n=1 Tax=Rhizobium sp. SEMIA 4085 TaxID=2137761 RepID=UPI001AEF30D5
RADRTRGRTEQGLPFTHRGQIDGGGDMADRKSKGKDTWDWCRNCSAWPTSDCEEKPYRRGRPAGTIEDCCA